MDKLLVIFGPTSSGKTDLSLKLADYIFSKYHVTCEIVGTDSRQLYKGMDIGTAKVTKDVRRRYKHHFIDIMPPTQKYSSDKFKTDVKKVLQTTAQQGKLPILVGGSGTFVMGVIGNRHLVNANQPDTMTFQTLVLVPYFERPQLYRKIEHSVDEMFQGGLYSEVKRLIGSHQQIPGQLKVTHGYREFIEYAAKNNKDIRKFNVADLSKIKWQIKQHTKKYAMHQSSWLNKMQDYYMVKNLNEAEHLVDNFMAEQ